MHSFPYPKSAFTFRDGLPYFDSPHHRAGQPVPVQTINGEQFVRIGSGLYPLNLLRYTEPGDTLPQCLFVRPRDGEIAAKCKQGITLPAIARDYGITKQGVKAIVDRLVAEGMCVKPKDARKAMKAPPAAPQAPSTPAAVPEPPPQSAEAALPATQPSTPKPPQPNQNVLDVLAAWGPDEDDDTPAPAPAPAPRSYTKSESELRIEAARAALASAPVPETRHVDTDDFGPDFCIPEPKAKTP